MMFDADDLELQLREAEVIAEGPLNNAYRLVSDGAQVFVRARTYPYQDSYAQVFAAEEAIYPLLPRSVPVPALLQRGVLPRSGQQFAIFEWIATTTPALFGGDVTSALARHMAGVHSVEGKGFGAFSSLTAQKPAPTFVLSLLSAEIAQAAEFASSEVDYAALAAAASLFEDETPTLCHGDIHLGNLLFGIDDELYLIDWEGARWRIPASDFNQTHLGWLTSDEQFQLIQAYCAMTSRDIQSLMAQIAWMQAFWHLRTRNFTNLSGRRVFGLTPADHDRIAGPRIEQLLERM